MRLVRGPAPAIRTLATSNAGACGDWAGTETVAHSTHASAQAIVVCRMELLAVRRLPDLVGFADFVY
jgi:hypothetical protein